MTEERSSKAKVTVCSLGSLPTIRPFNSIQSNGAMNPPPPPPQSFPYDHLFKILTIGDAGVGKVRCSAQLCFGVLFLF